MLKPEKDHMLQLPLLATKSLFMLNDHVNYTIFFLLWECFIQCEFLELSLVRVHFCEVFAPPSPSSVLSCPGTGERMLIQVSE